MLAPAFHSRPPRLPSALRMRPGMEAMNETAESKPLAMPLRTSLNLSANHELMEPKNPVIRPGMEETNETALSNAPVMPFLASLNLLTNHWPMLAKNACILPGIEPMNAVSAFHPF